MIDKIKNKRCKNGLYDNILTKEYLYKQYIELNKTIPDICNEIGCKIGMVYKLMRKYSIPNKRLFDSNHQINKKYGDLTVIKYVGKNKFGFRIWLCRCKCGKEINIIINDLKSGHSKSCGCSKKLNCNFRHHGWKGYGEISGKKFTKFKNRAKEAGLAFDITIEYIWDLFLSQNKKCKLTGLPLTFAQRDNQQSDTTASLDRIDSSKGYIEGNVQWVYKDINQMKWNFELRHFINLCHLVAKENTINE